MTTENPKSGREGDTASHPSTESTPVEQTDEVTPDAVAAEAATAGDDDDWFDDVTDERLNGGMGFLDDCRSVTKDDR